MYSPKTPATPGGVSTALPPSCLIFQRTVRTHENHDIFCEKIVCHGVLTATKALQRSSHGVLSRSNGVHGGDSLRSNGSFTARPRHSQRMPRTFTALTLCWRPSDISKNAVQSPCKCHGRPRHLHNDPCVRPQSSYCVVWDLTARLWWPYRVPSALV